MRQRIACFVLILTLTLPAVGHARLSSLDPDGQNIVFVEATTGEVAEPSLFHLFVTWVQTYVFCL